MWTALLSLLIHLFVLVRERQQRTATTNSLDRRQEVRMGWFVVSEAGKVKTPEKQTCSVASHSHSLSHTAGNARVHCCKQIRCAVV